MLLVT
ncbi:hypothetical protein YPPY05_1790, partial [Yersinia pestis PY-05]